MSSLSVNLLPLVPYVFILCAIIDCIDPVLGPYLLTYKRGKWNLSDTQGDLYSLGQGRCLGNSQED